MSLPVGGLSPSPSTCGAIACGPVRFYLVVIDPGLLAHPDFEEVDLCVSRNRWMQRTFWLDPGKTPRHFDLIVYGMTIPGIYRFTRGQAHHLPPGAVRGSADEVRVP